MDKIMLSQERYGRFENDDLIDRVNYRYTVMALMMCIFIIIGKTYVGDAINCWTPAQFAGTHNAYTNSICWLKGSYYLPTEEITIPDRSKPRIHHVSYYQWTPFILLGMAMLFLIPPFIWDALTRQSGLNIRRLVKTIKDEKTHDKGIEFTKKTLKLFLDTQYRLNGSPCCGYRFHNFYSGFTAMFFTIKILYLVNTIVQFFLIDAFLSFRFTSTGSEVINKLFTGEDWFESSKFPRVTMCDFMIRHLGSNQHWYAIQCTLPINIYNEKIFLGVWLWLIILGILNFLSLIFFIITIRRPRQLATIKKYLRMHSPPSEEGPKLNSRSKRLQNFLTYLTIDGFLMFDLLAKNTDDFVAASILEDLFKHFESTHRNDMTNV